MDYKGYDIRHHSFHREECEIDANGNVTELRDTVEVHAIQSGYGCPEILDGHIFVCFENLRQFIDNDAPVKTKSKIEAKFIMCQIPEGAVLARYCVETSELTFSNFSEWTKGKGHIYE